jgi:hypothetical protein
MMNDEDIKKHHDLIEKLETYQPLPLGIVVADSAISGHGLFTTRRLVTGTELGISHYRIDGEYIRTPLGGFINHSDEPNCERYQGRIRPGFDRWNIVVIEDIDEGDELTLKYKLYDPNKKK